jgi:hypothetical protein
MYIVHIPYPYTEYHSVCPLPGIGTLPPPLSPVSVPLPPQPKKIRILRIRNTAHTRWKIYPPTPSSVNMGRGETTTYTSTNMGEISCTATFLSPRFQQFLYCLPGVWADSWGAEAGDGWGWAAAPNIRHLSRPSAPRRSRRILHLQAQV